MQHSVKLFLVLAGMILWSAAAQADKLDKIVAVVNGDIILYSELQESIRLIEQASPEVKTDDSARKAQIEREVLQQMVRERLTEQEVRRMKISVSDREVDEAIAGFKKENNFTDAQFDMVLQQRGQTLAQFREGVKKELERGRLLDRVLKSKTVITPEQVEAHLKGEAGESLGSKERRRLGIIFVPVQEGAEGKGNEAAETLARDIHNQLKGGGDFARLAREHSKGPAAEEGGDIGFIASDELAPAIEAATRGLKANDISDVMKTPGGYTIFKVFDVQREKQDRADPGLHERVRRQLFQAELNRKFEEWVRELEARSFIKLSL